MSGLSALVLLGVVAVTADRDEHRERIQAGPGPAGSPSFARSGDQGNSTDGSSRPMANGKIAFIRSTGPSDPAPKIYVMNEDGSDQTMIAETTQGGDLAWSPDGTQLAFRDVGGIYVVNADGTDERKVPGTSSDQSPAWSPDGTNLAVRSLEDMTGGIAVLGIDGTGRKRLTTGMMDGSPAWSPDGSKIAFSSGEDIYVVDADGSSRKRITSLDGIEDAPAWSPDGRQLVFRHNSSITAIDLDGGKARQLASPGGTALVDPAGRGANKLAAGRGDPSEPAWSPDGKRIVFVIYQTGENCRIWVMDADGSAQSALTSGNCDRDPAWQPRPA